MRLFCIFVALATIGKHIDTAAQTLENGGLVAIPTETVYGLAANAINETAVLKIFEAKQRPFFDPLIIHVASLTDVSRYAELTDARLKSLAEGFWPGPITLLLPKKSIVPDLVTSGLPQVAIRVPKHELTLELLRKVSFPLAAPSANPFGYVSPTEPEHVNKQLGDKVDYILDGGKCEVGLESTIVGIEDGVICVYRLGGLALEEIEKVVGKVELRLNLSSDPKAPGQLKNHYAPRKPLFIGDLNELVQKNKAQKIAAIIFGKKELSQANYIFNLSEGGDLKEAAVNLFAVLRKIDETDADMIIVEPLPDEGLGRAINDRLKRAEFRS
ncbi:MAG: L-threonylcarbamoyladenylate synthase [Sphingobacteriaceae bacterium]